MEKTKFSKEVDESNILPSRFQIGDEVLVNMFEAGYIKNCKVIKIHFTKSKVSYDLEIDTENLFTRLYNIDSVFIDSLMLNNE